jgi:AAA15 family ATPase/GTPase
MIEALEIKKFRCFDFVEVIGLRRINIIVGANASGKTTLLESLFLISGKPEISFRLKTWRGLGDRVTVNAQTWEDSPWKDLFFNLDRDNLIFIGLKNSVELTRSLRISAKPSQGVLIPQPGEASQATAIAPIEFEWSKGNKTLGIVQPVLTPKGLTIEGAPEPLPVSFFASAVPIYVEETANRISQLSKQKEDRKFFELIRQLFPIIEDLSIEIETGVPMIHASLSAVPRKIPLGLVSSGISKLVAILSAIATQRVVLIDELENGIHYKKLPEVWSALNETAKTYDTQIFASTHSKECLDALVPAMEGRENDFALLRTRSEHGKYIVDSVAGEHLYSALKEGIEIR